jgi:heme oxygenase
MISGCTSFAESVWMHLLSQMLTRLQLETRTLHPEADAPWVELMSLGSQPSDVTREQYIATLILTYGFEGPIEAAVALTPGMNTVLPLRQRSRTGFIVQDLLVLGLTPSRIARLPQCCHVVPFRDVSEALGWMYVVERATLLHDTVRRQLEAKLPGLAAFSYLSAYEGVTGQRWQELGHVLDLVALTNDSGAQIVAGAKAAFATLHEWLANVEADPIARSLS